MKDLYLGKKSWQMRLRLFHKTKIQIMAHGAIHPTGLGYTTQAMVTSTVRKLLLSKSNQIREGRPKKGSLPLHKTTKVKPRVLGCSWRVSDKENLLHSIVQSKRQGGKLSI